MDGLNPHTTLLLMVLAGLVLPVSSSLIVAVVLNRGTKYEMLRLKDKLADCEREREEDRARISGLEYTGKELRKEIAELRDEKMAMTLARLETQINIVRRTNEAARRAAGGGGDDDDVG